MQPGTYLPADLPTPPVYSKMNPADAPILTLALTSKTLPLSQVRGSGRHAPRAEDFAACRALDWCVSAAGRGPPCAFRRILRRSPPMGCTLEDLRVALAAANVESGQRQLRWRRTSPHTIGANDQLLIERRLSPA